MNSGETETKSWRAPASIGRTAAKLAVATVCGLGFGIAMQTFLFTMVLRANVESRDFVVYWATGQQLTHHANPYDTVALLSIEHSGGLEAPHGAMFMRNPPWTLPAVYPLGFAGLWPASLAWSLLLLASLLVSVYLLWGMHGRPNNNRILLAYSFAPAFICLITGQSSLFALLGLVLFLRLHRNYPFLAGMSLWLCTLKPHLFLPFGVVLLAWIVVSRSYRLLAGGLVALAASCAATVAIDPLALRQYLQMLHTSGIERDFILCLSFVLRYWLGPWKIWIQYIPAALGCTWALGYFWPRRKTWDWMSDGSLVMLVSILVAPYSWLFDQVLAIPALLQGAYLTRSRAILVVLALFSGLIEAALVCTKWFPSAVYLWTLWTAPAWLAWYLVATSPSEGPATAWTARLPMGWFRANAK